MKSYNSKREDLEGEDQGEDERRRDKTKLMKEKNSGTCQPPVGSGFNLLFIKSKSWEHKRNMKNIGFGEDK